MKNKNFLESFKCAAKGFLKAFKVEKKFKIYLLHLILAIILNIIFKTSLTQNIICFVIAMGVFSSECFNIVIEKACDLYTTEYNEDIKFIKDISAGGVFCWGITFYIVELIYLINFLLNIF